MTTARSAFETSGHLEARSIMKLSPGIYPLNPFIPHALPNFSHFNPPFPE
jgi:hypothetical protein